MKILLFGGSGLLGSALAEKASTRSHNVVAPSHLVCDLTNANQVKEFVRETKPNLVINAAGFTNVDGAEEDPTLAETLNHTSVSNLVDALKTGGTPLVHFSTDYVFNGAKIEGYLESDAVSPINEYGRSKASAEHEMTQNLTNFYIIRTSWLFGPNGKNFVDTMLDLAAKGQKEITVVSDQIGCPTYTMDLADAVLDLIKTQKYGIYHMTNEGSTSWFDFAVQIFYSLGLPQKVLPITSKDLNRKAVRPHYSILKNTKTPLLRNWKEALTEYLMSKEILL